MDRANTVGIDISVDKDETANSLPFPVTMLFFSCLRWILLFAIAAEVSGFLPVSVWDGKSPMTRSSFRNSEQHARIGGGGWATEDDRNTDEKYPSPDDDEREYQEKLAEAKAAIAAAKEARAKYYTNKRDRTDSTSQMLSVPSSSSNSLQPSFKAPIRSRIEFTDAGTMLVNIPPPGASANSIFSGAFSVAWFSAVVPATFATGGAGLLFMLPFWAAGGLVAKQAIVDPFMAFQLSIGQYAWSLAKTYAGKTVSKPVDGATDQLQGALVELGIIVNDVPQYELRLYSSQTTKGGVTALGLGLPEEELEYLAVEINNHLANMKTFPDDEDLLDDD